MTHLGSGVCIAAVEDDCPIGYSIIRRRALLRILPRTFALVQLEAAHDRGTGVRNNATSAWEVPAAHISSYSISSAAMASTLGGTVLRLEVGRWKFQCGDASYEVKTNGNPMRWDLVCLPQSTTLAARVGHFAFVSIEDAIQRGKLTKGV
jgi:hypothetical protein